jgi:putative ABC transport system permease protein
MGESFVLVLVAFVIALSLVEFVLPAFNAFVGRELAFDYSRDSLLPLQLAGFVLLTALLSGSYPAFFLSAFQPGKVLKGDLPYQLSGDLFRNLLVIMQFSIAIVLLVATAVVYFQLAYANESARGFDRERILVLSASENEGMGPQWETMRQRLLGLPGISNVTASDQIPLNPYDKTGPVKNLEQDDAQGRTIPRAVVDYGFFATYRMNIVAGRSFEPDRTDRLQAAATPGGNRSRNYLINESAAREFGWEPEQAVGKQLEYLFVPGTVIGVVEDNYLESLRNAIKPMLYMLPAPGQALPIASLRLTGDEIAATLESIDAIWQTFMPEYPLQRRFLVEDFDALYRNEQRQGELFSYFALLAIVISCFGLYGLAAFTTERRTREIGVRKVMGGSVWSIVLLLTNDFSKLVLLSNLIAWPVAWFAMSRWLENFAYRIDLTPLIFIGSGLIALCIAWVTVGGTAAKAASAKPVLALRYE